MVTLRFEIFLYVTLTVLDVALANLPDIGRLEFCVLLLAEFRCLLFEET